MPVSEVKNEDCIIGMKRFPDKFFDLAIVDPPYGIDFANEKERKPTATRSAQFKFKCKKWDKEIPDKDYFLELFRVSKEQIIWGGNYFLDFLPKTNCVIIWDKFNPEGMRFSDGEMAWGSFKTSLRICKILRTYRIEVQMHPTQKPVALYDWIIKNYAKLGDKVLDTHLGSQSSRIAAYKLGFDFWGWELDKQYFDEGNARFEKAIDEPFLKQIENLKQGTLL